MMHDPLSIARHRFRNALCILRSIDGDEFMAATGVDGARWWPRFRDDPARTFLQLDDDMAEAVWRIVEGRQPAELRTEPSLMQVAAE